MSTGLQSSSARIVGAAPFRIFFRFDRGVVTHQPDETDTAQEVHDALVAQATLQGLEDELGVFFVHKNRLRDGVQTFAIAHTVEPAIWPEDVAEDSA